MSLEIYFLGKRFSVSVNAEDTSTTNITRCTYIFRDVTDRSEDDINPFEKSGHKRCD